MTMRTADALALVASIATRWGENAEEGLTTRVQAATTDAECATVAEASGAELEEVTELRDLWRAQETVKALLEQQGCEGFDAGARDGMLTTLCDIIVFG